MPALNLTCGLQHVLRFLVRSGIVLLDALYSALQVEQPQDKKRCFRTLSSVAIWKPIVFKTHLFLDSYLD